MPSDRSPSIERRGKLLARELIRKLKKALKGVTVSTTAKGWHSANRAKAQVSFRLREKLKQGRRPLSPRELHFERMIGGSETDKFALLPTGRLRFEFGRRFIDETEDQPFEERVHELTEAIVESLKYEDIRIGETEERERRCAAAAEKRRQAYEERLEEEKRQRSEQERWQRFVQMSHEWHTVKRVESFLEVVMASGDGSLSSEQIQWLKAQIKKRDPLALERSLSEELA